MIIDSNGKLFGKISIVDIFIIVVIIALIAGVAVRVSGSKGRAVVTGNKFSYTIEILNVREYTLKAVDDSLNCHFYSCEKTGDDMGVLVDVKKAPGTKLLEKADGTAVMTEVPDNYNLKLTFEIDGKINERGYYTTLMRALNVGSGHTIRSKYSTVFGTINKIWQ